MSLEQTQNTIYLQARRASKLLHTNLPDAKNFIAQAFYLCNDYQDLLRKIKHKKIDSSVFPYSQIHAETSDGSADYLRSTIDNVISHVEKYLKKPHTDFQIRSFIFAIFDVSNTQSPNEEIDTHKFELWYRLSFGEGDYSDAVRMRECMVNNVPFQLYFNKVVLAESFEVFGRQTSRFLNEQVLSEFAYPPLFWQPELRWSKALEGVLCDLQQDKQVDMTKVFECEHDINPVQQIYETQVRRLLMALDEELLGENLKTFEIENGFYQVLGYPVSDIDCEGNINRLPKFEITKADLRRNTAFVLIEGQAICFHFFPVDINGRIVGELEAMHTEIMNQILEFECAEKRFVEIEGEQYFAIARCVTDAEAIRLHHSQLRLAYITNFDRCDELLSEPETKGVETNA